MHPHFDVYISSPLFIWIFEHGNEHLLHRGWYSKLRLPALPTHALFAVMLLMPFHGGFQLISGMMDLRRYISISLALSKLPKVCQNASSAIAVALMRGISGVQNCFAVRHLLTPPSLCAACSGIA